MNSHITPAPEGQPPACSNMDSEGTPLQRLEQLFCTNERHGVLLGAIDDNLHDLMAMDDGESRNREIERCWLLFWAARDLRDRLHRELGDVLDAFYAERRKGAAA